MTPVDLRSDILVRPTDAMMRAMADAANRPRSYGIRECPDQRRLEARTAELLGKEDALFFPTCTMANQAALMLFCARGQAVLSEARTHVAGTEEGATAGVAGVAVRRVEGTRGHLSPETVAAALQADQSPPMRATKLVWLENTHNMAGGTVLPDDWRKGTAAICSEHGVAVHMDGARLWNAEAALGQPAAKLVDGVTSVAVSLNKALGAPLGAVFAGTAANVADALEIRQMLGGGWRRAGLVAVAGLVALDTMRSRIVEDHVRARRLAEAIVDQAHGLEIDLDGVQTNIVNVGVGEGGMTASQLVMALERRGVMAVAHGEEEIRLVTHAEIDDAQIDAAISAFDDIGQSQLVRRAAR